MRFDLTREYLDNLRDIIYRKNETAALNLLNDLHAADIAEIYDSLDIEEARFLYLLLDGEKAADVLAELEEDDRERFLKILPSDVIARQFIDYMDSDNAADVIGDLPIEKQKEVLSYVKDLERVDDISDLLSYPEDTAGGIMAKELIAVNMKWDLKTCLKEIARQAEEVDEVYYVYVINDENVLQGKLSLKKLLVTNTTNLVSDIYNPNIMSVKPETKAEEVGNIMDKYDIIALPVTDALGRLIGRITIDDVVDVIREEAERDYQMMSGITSDVEPSDKVLVLTRARLPWLFVGLIGGIFGAQIISMYEHDLDQNAAMAFFIPLIAAMGGNVGVQSSAIVVQALASNTLGMESTFRKIIKELSVALINGITCSSFVFIYNLIFSDSFALTLTVSISLMIVIVFASLFGTLVPLALNRFKIDPALATGPFITTVNDVLGLFFYLMIGRVIFGMV